MSTPLISTTARERSAFDFFVAIGAQEIWNVSPSKEWIPLVLQCATTDVAVFQAVTAVSTVQRSLALTVHKVFEAPRARRNLDFAMQQFSKATSSLQRHIDSAKHGHPINMEPVLLCAILFICFELLRGKYQNAIAHMQFGRRIVMGLNADPQVQKGLAPVRPALPKGLMDGFSRVFHVLGNSIIYSDRPSGLDQDSQLLKEGVPSALPLAFGSLEQAQEHFHMLCSSRNELRTQLVQKAEERISKADKDTLEPGVLLCITHCLTRAVAASSDARMRARIEQLINAHYGWIAALNNLEKNATSSSDPQAFLLLAVLKIKHFFALHTLHTCISVRETDHDAYMPAFKDMVDLIDRFFVIHAANMMPGVTGPLLPLHPDVEKQGSFSLEPAVLPTMALIAFKCRDTILRRRVIALLYSAQRREAGLTSIGMGCFIRRIVNIEENEARSMMGIPAEEPLRAEQVPEAARFLDIAMRGESPKCTMVAAARFRHDEGDKQLEVREFAWEFGYPVTLQEAGIYTFPYVC